MLTKIYKLTSLLTSLLFAGASIGNGGVTLSSGWGIHQITPYRLGLLWDFGPCLLVGAGGSAIHLLLESSAGVWDGPKRPDLAPGRPTDLMALTLGPMIRWQRACHHENIFWSPYFEIGIAASYISEKEIQGRVLSLHFQFEDKAGAGIRFGTRQQYELGARVYHYSNASIKRPNSGVNLAMANVGFWFH